MTENEKEQLYSGLVNACQQYGFTTEHTYDLLHSVVDSIVDEPEDLEGDPGDWTGRAGTASEAWDRDEM
jgi:hypothetical protein